MPSYQVRRSISINKPQAEILEFLANYKNWPAWSPWLIQEPNCPLSYTDSQGQIGDGYEWNGDLVGAGSMALTDKNPNGLSMKLSFKRPFKSEADVFFGVHSLEGEEGCEVSWVMHGNLPWYLFFLKGMFKNWIAMDYDRGLKMLKSQLETGHVHSQLEIIGKRPLEHIHYMALKGKATIAELGPVMENHFHQFEMFLEKENIEPVGPPFALYEKMDKRTTASEFLTCFPISLEDKEKFDMPFSYGQIDAGNSYVVKHTGEYPFMGNAWACAMGASRHNKVKVKFKPMGMERYLNDPGEVAPKDLETEVILFAK